MPAHPVLARAALTSLLLQSNHATTKLTGHAKNLAEAEIRYGEICPNTPQGARKMAPYIIRIIERIIQSLERGVMRNHIMFIRITNVQVVYVNSE